MSDKTSYITQAGFDKIKQELEYLKKVRRAEIANRIKEAKELGDLSENAEYAAAREEQAFVEGRILEIQAMLKDVQLIHDQQSDPNIVQIGDTVEVENRGIKHTYTIVGSNEADPANYHISNESPIGRAFLGRHKGEQAVVNTPKGERTYTILAIQ